MDASLLAMMRDERSPLMDEVVEQWTEGEGGCLEVDLTSRDSARVSFVGALRDAGCDRLLVHGVARPHRPWEIETLFVFAAGPGEQRHAQHRRHLQMMLPYLHTGFLRVQVLERQAGAPAGGHGNDAAQRSHGGTAAQITQREREILHWVRDGKSNAEIGQLLGISGLTVKNHVHKMLKKLAAANRAQAVARAIGARVIAPENMSR